MIPKTAEKTVVYVENNKGKNSMKSQKLDGILPDILNEYENQISEEEDEFKPFNCDLCKRDYLSKKLLKEHNKRRHEFPCKLCKIKFITKDQKEDHDADVHPPQESSAILNELKISAQKSRLAQLKLDLNNSDRYFECSMCMKKFATENRLKDHKGSYHGLFKDEQIYHLCPKPGCEQGSIEREWMEKHKASCDIKGEVYVPNQKLEKAWLVKKANEEITLPTNCLRININAREDEEEESDDDFLDF